MRPFFPAVVLLSAASLAGAAAAHAFLEQASPRVGSSISAAPAAVRLSFSEPVEPVFSTVIVSGPAGFAGSEPARAAEGDRRTLVAPLRRPMPPGRYVVRWRAVSVDSHITQGDFHFELKP